uniref:Uncharacterized protein n=1 Tax=Anguilla anguilla TaxID=7936 RepID=A0A0E9PR36_ANGAN
MIYNVSISYTSKWLLGENALGKVKTFNLWKIVL